MKESKTLKIICYILLPILIGIMCVALFYTTYKDMYRFEISEDYFESEEFASQFMNALNNEIQTTIYNDNNMYMYTEDGFRVYYAYKNINGFSNFKNCKFIIGYLPRGKIYTNVSNMNESITLEEIIKYMEQSKRQKVHISGGEINTTSDIIRDTWNGYKTIFTGAFYYSDGEYYDKNEQVVTDSLEKQKEASEVLTNKGNVLVKYGVATDNLEEIGVTYVDYSINDFEIYVTYEEEFNLNSDEMYVLNILKTFKPYENLLYISIPICGLLAVIMIWFLILAIGHEKDEKEIKLNDIDKIPLEIIFLVLVTMFSLIMYVINNFSYKSGDFYKLYISELVTAYLVMYTLMAITFASCVKRIKAKTFVRNTIFWRVLKLIKKILDKIRVVLEVLSEKFSITIKLAGISLFYILLMIFILVIFEGEVGIGIFIDVVITIYLFYQVVRRANALKTIEEKLKDIYEGNNKERLIEEEFTNEFKNAIEYINDISNGLEVAVEERIKSERLKTELITNVSHDIKTPLTSIINYVDLIKRENIENEKLKEYVEILEAKAQRLKRLTEDLVEASKASSGNVKLNLEILNLGELINQTTGEFEDKFKEKGLEVVVEIPDEEITIFADSRYMYRIIENAFSNVAKYALTGSRVYVDVIHVDENVRLEIKNISAAKLNISEEELMQRFVRGDKSRTTEGSGLGLSISKSLTELQHGKFDIHIDGDLFKVNIEFKIVAGMDT